MSNALSILGLGTYLPPVRLVRDQAATAGVDVTRYRGWDRYAVAEGDDHPSTMGARALLAALGKSGRSASDLRLVLFVGMSRDYQPSWSVATEVMRLVSAPSSCLGVDLTVGCLGVLAGLEFAASWVGAHGAEAVAIVAAERWSHTVTRTDASALNLWGYADGAAAVVAGAGAGAIASYQGSCFISQSEHNGLILVKHGGTRFPVAPPGVDPFLRSIVHESSADTFANYAAGYSSAFDLLAGRFSGKPDALVCNQIAPRFVRAIGEAAHVSASDTCLTGPLFGHVGSADLLIGLDQLREEDKLRGSIWLGANTPYAFGAGLVTTTG